MTLPGHLTALRAFLASGRRVRLFGDICLASPLAYCVDYRENCAGLPRTVAFREGLLTQPGATTC